MDLLKLVLWLNIWLIIINTMCVFEGMCIFLFFGYNVLYTHLVKIVNSVIQTSTSLLSLLSPETVCENLYYNQIFILVFALNTLRSCY